MKTRKAVWVVVDGNDAQVFPNTVRSTHRSWDAAQRASGKARRAGHRLASVVSAQVIALMQQGHTYTEAVQAKSGAVMHAVDVTINESPDAGTV